MLQACLPMPLSGTLITIKYSRTKRKFKVFKTVIEHCYGFESDLGTKFKNSLISSALQLIKTCKQKQLRSQKQAGDKYKCSRDFDMVCKEICHNLPAGDVLDLEDTTYCSWAADLETLD